MKLGAPMRAAERKTLSRMTLVLGLVEHFVSFVRTRYRSKELFCHANVEKIPSPVCFYISFIAQLCWSRMVSGKMNFGLVYEFFY